MSFIELKSKNDFIKSLLESRLDGERERIELTACDHNEVSYLITSSKGDKKVVINAAVPCYGELKDKCQAGKYLSEVYGNVHKSSTVDGYNICFEIDTEECKSDEALVDKYAHIGGYLLAIPYLWAFNTSISKQNAAPLVLSSKNGENTYVLPLVDRVIVCFGFNFIDENDKTIAKVFLTELINCRKSQSYSSALQLYYGGKPPAELGRIIDKIGQNADISYATFVFLPLSYSSNVKKEECAGQMSIFRTYLRHHIKASNVMMHTRMRNRVESFLKILNRAKSEATTNPKNTVRMPRKIDRICVRAGDFY